MSTNDALVLRIARYVRAVQASGNHQSRVQSAAFWNSLGLERSSEQHVALVREAFEKHQIAVSTSIGDLGHESPDAWIVLTATGARPDRVARISELPESLFGASSAPVEPTYDLSVRDVTPSDPTRGSSVAPAAQASVAAPPPSETASQRSTDTPDRTHTRTNESIACPSCGSTVTLSASYCSGCGRPNTHVPDQHVLPTARIDEPPMSVFERARIEGWLPSVDEFERPGVPLGSMIIIGIVVLSVGARLGDVLMPFLVVAALVFIGATWWKPSLRTVVMGHRRRGRAPGSTTPSVAQIVSAVAVVASLVSVSFGTGMFSGDNVNMLQNTALLPTRDDPVRTRSVAAFATETRNSELIATRPFAPTLTVTSSSTRTPQPTVTPTSGSPTTTPEATLDSVPLTVTSTTEQTSP